MNARRLVMGAMAASLAACSDGTMAPTMESASASSNAAGYGGGATQALTHTDTVRFSITINPSRTTYYDLGEGNTLTFPAGSLCDPSRSTYGESEWDKPCTKATSPLTVGVKAWQDSKGHARVDFDQHIRFVPSNTPSQWVVITFDDWEAALDPFFTILYCPTSTSKCKDESRKDYTLLPTKNRISGKIQRRIKHFSGYNVAAGRDAEDSDGFDNWWSATTSASTRVLVAATPQIVRPKQFDPFIGKERVIRQVSGYILASG